MASYNGISIKGMKTFRDHEGLEIAQGNLYIGNKKIGFWSMDSWGGPDIIDLDAKYDIDKLEKCLAERGMDLDFAMWELLRLKDDETLWKKSECPRIFIGDDGYHQFWICVKDPDIKVKDVLARKDVQGYIEEKFFKNKDSHLFRIVDENSFDTGWPITIDDIKKEGATK